MSEILLIERAVAVLCLAHIMVAVIRTIEAIKVCVILGVRYEQNVDFTSICAFVLSACVVVKWVAGS